MRIFRLAAPTLVAGLALAACGGDFESIDRPGSGDTGKVRIVNATNANTSIDLYDSGTALQSGVPINGASGYSSVSTGSRALTVRNNGSSATIATAPVTSVRDDHQVVIVSTRGGGNIASVLPENDAAPSAGMAKLRILNTDTANVDVYVVTTTCAANETATTPAFATNAGSTATPYATVTASNTPYRLCITATGDRTNLRADVGALTLSDQRIVTVILTLNGSSVLKALALDQQAAAAPLTSTP